MRALWFTALLVAVPACSTYRDELARSQHAFEQNQHEKTLAILRMLELDTSHLDRGEQARYAYLRGMTDFRMGYKADARHWLAVAKAMDEKSPGLVPADWRARLDQSLGELDKDVWANGMETLSLRPLSVKPAKAAPAKKPVVRNSDEEEEQAPRPKKKPLEDEDE